MPGPNGSVNGAKDPPQQVAWPQQQAIVPQYPTASGASVGPNASGMQMSDVLAAVPASQVEHVQQFAAHLMQQRQQQQQPPAQGAQQLAAQPPKTEAKDPEEPAAKPTDVATPEQVAAEVEAAAQVAALLSVEGNAPYVLAQLAEESAQTAASAAAFCAAPGDDGTSHVIKVAEAAQQASMRAHWAASVLGTYDQGDSSIAAMRQIAQQSAESAEAAAVSCKHQAALVEAAHPVKGMGRSKVPCKYFVEGKCWRGSACEFSHDPVDSKPRPLMLKKQEECHFFSQGSCARGTACPFAHGKDELAEIQRYVTRIKNEKAQQRKFQFWRRNPDVDD